MGEPAKKIITDPGLDITAKNLTAEKIKKTVSPELWKKLTERVYLIHSKNDKIIKFKNFEENRLILEIPDKNMVIFNKGGHALKKNEIALVGTSIKFFQQ